jgi:predicted RNase H-like HicB family nuclease
MMTRSYLVVYEKGANNWSGYSPQVLGCISVGDSLEEMRSNFTSGAWRKTATLYLKQQTAL